MLLGPMLLGLTLLRPTLLGLTLLRPTLLGLTLLGPMLLGLTLPPGFLRRRSRLRSWLPDAGVRP